MRFNANVGVGWFAEHTGCDVTIIVASYPHIQESDRLVFFQFSSELDARVDSVQAVIEFRDGVTFRIATSQSGTLRGIEDRRPAIINIDLDVTWDNAATTFRDFDGLVNSVGHPYLPDRHHEGKADGS